MEIHSTHGKKWILVINLIFVQRSHLRVVFLFLILENITALIERFKALLRYVNIYTTLGIIPSIKKILEDLKGFYGVFLLCIEVYLLELLYCYRIVVMKQGKAV